MGRIRFTLIKLEGKQNVNILFYTWEHNMTKQGEHKLTILQKYNHFQKKISTKSIPINF